MAQLAELFSSLVAPSSDDGNPFSAVPIPDSPSHRVGKDGSGYPCLLIRVENAPTAGRLPSLQLERLAVHHDVRCRIADTDTQVTTIERLTVVRCKDHDLISYFLRICEPVVATLGDSPHRSEVSRIVSRLAELFQSISRPPRGSVQGLWAELFVITTSRDPAVLVEAWHVNPEDRFDFTLGDQRLEVKSTSGPDRRHRFSLNQVRVLEDIHVLVASLFVEPAGGGSSLGELVDRIIGQLEGHPELALYVDHMVALTLGQALQRGLEERFDFERARDSLTFFRGRDIPSVSPELPPSVSSVQFTADLTDTPEAYLGAHRDYGDLFRALP